MKKLKTSLCCVSAVAAMLLGVAAARSEGDRPEPTAKSAGAAGAASVVRPAVGARSGEEKVIREIERS